MTISTVAPDQDWQDIGFMYRSTDHQYFHLFALDLYQDNTNLKDLEQAVASFLGLGKRLS